MSHRKVACTKLLMSVPPRTCPASRDISCFSVPTSKFDIWHPQKGPLESLYCVVDLQKVLASMHRKASPQSNFEPLLPQTLPSQGQQTKLEQQRKLAAQKPLTNSIRLQENGMKAGLLTKSCQASCRLDELQPGFSKSMS